MNHDLEKKLKSYEDRIKDLENKFFWCNDSLDRMESDLWDHENQNCENEDA
jgi:chromosome segregation ATPase